MQCGDHHGVDEFLVGLHRVGVIGLPDALERAVESGLEKREAIVDLLLEQLSAENFVPDSQLEPYRIALWREYLKHRGRDASEYFSEIEVTVRGEPGEGRDGLVEALLSVLGRFDLRPEITFAAPEPGGPDPELWIAGESVFRGAPRNRWSFEAAIRKSLSGW